MKVRLPTEVRAVEDTGDGVRAIVAPATGGREGGAGGRPVHRHLRLPPVEDYGFETTGGALDDRGAIAVDERGRTNVDHAYAIGDCTGKLMLAHVAEAIGHRGR